MAERVYLAGLGAGGGVEGLGDRVSKRVLARQLVSIGVVSEVGDAALGIDDAGDVARRIEGVGGDVASAVGELQRAGLFVEGLQGLLAQCVGAGSKAAVLVELLLDDDFAVGVGDLAQQVAVVLGARAVWRAVLA